MSQAPRSLLADTIIAITATTTTPSNQVPAPASPPLEPESVPFTYLLNENAVESLAMDSTTDLRYPVGDFSAPASSTPELRSSQIKVLRVLPATLKSAVESLTENQLETPYREGGWTVRQTIHHVADSHANAYVRFKLALTEDWPIIKPYEEARWAELADSRLSIDLSLTLLTALHLRWVTVLESMTEADFEKGYIHPARKQNGGRQPLWEVLAMYDWHSRHHTAHIANLRSRMGW